MGIGLGDTMECKEQQRRRKSKAKRCNHERRLDTAKGESTAELMLYLGYGPSPNFKIVCDSQIKKNTYPFTSKENIDEE